MPCYLDTTQTPKKRYQEGGIFAFVLDVFFLKTFFLKKLAINTGYARKQNSAVSTEFVGFS